MYLSQRRRRPRVQHDERRREIAERYLVQCLAGRAAERRLVRGGRARHHFWDGDDARQASILARLLGAGRRVRQVRSFVMRYMQRTEALVREHWSAVEALARQLEYRYAQAILDGADVRRIIDHARRARARGRR